MKRRWAWTLLVLFLLTFGINSAFANDELKRRERELEILEEQMSALNASIDNNKALQNKTNQKIQTLYSEVKKLEKEIVTLTGQIENTTAMIAEKQVEIEMAQEAIAKKNERLNDRLRVMYKSGNFGYMEVLFGAEDFTDLLTRVDMLQLILKHDQDLLVTMKSNRDAVEAQKVELENKKNALNGYVTEKTQKQNHLSDSMKNLVSYKEALLEDAAALEEMEQTALSEADQLVAIIQNLKLAPKYIGGEMIWPLPGYYEINSDFGERIHPITKVYSKHTGIDIPAKQGTPIIAAQTGTIVYADWFGTYGRAVIIDHGGGLTTLYAHCDALYVTVGQAIKKGEQIAAVGSSGYSTGMHLHFEVREGGAYVDPKGYVIGK